MGFWGSRSGRQSISTGLSDVGAEGGGAWSGAKIESHKILEEQRSWSQQTSP